jgi:hypothetical protein
VASLRLQVDDTVVYEGPTVAVPREGDQIRHGDKTVRIESVVWDFKGASGDVLVKLVVSDLPYTF